MCVYVYLLQQHGQVFSEDIEIFDVDHSVGVTRRRQQCVKHRFKQLRVNLKTAVAAARKHLQLAHRSAGLHMPVTCLSNES